MRSAGVAHYMAEDEGDCIRQIKETAWVSSPEQHGDSSEMESGDDWNRQDDF